MDAQATFCLSVTQSDPNSLPGSPSFPAWPAQKLLPSQRRDLAVQALAGTQPVAALAREHHVSRKFIDHQACTARQALDGAFNPNPPADDVLFYLPVTKAWLRQLVLALVLIGHSSYRAVVELLRDLFDWHISLGNVHNVVRGAVGPARAISSHCDLAGVRIGAHDEIFQAGQPVLVGVDTASTYCYLLSLEDHRDAVTWGVRLLELTGQGFSPEATVADAASGLRAGQEMALPGVPCRGDVFHVIRDLEALVNQLERRAWSALETEEYRQQQRDQMRRNDRRGRAKSPYSAAQYLLNARAASELAVRLADEVALLVRWLRQDILAVAGPGFADRCALYDFIVAELRARAPLCPHRLEPTCRMLENQRDNLLAFARRLDEDLELLGRQFHLDTELLRRLLVAFSRDVRDPRRWTEEATIRKHLRGRFHEIRAAVAALADSTVRASSLVENLNSRLRNYFFLRRHLGSDYLALLQFFLNHRRLDRSDRAKRVGKTPAELLTGRSHPHWLELLGFTLFRRV